MKRNACGDQPQKLLCEEIQLIQLAEEGDVEKVRQLLQHPMVNLANCIKDALKNAVESMHTEIVRLLLSHPRVKPVLYLYKDAMLYLAVHDGDIKRSNMLLADPQEPYRVWQCANDLCLSQQKC